MADATAAAREASAPRGGSLRCFLLGDEPLLVRCAELLLERGHQIMAVVTETPAIERWAAERSIPLFGRREYVAAVEDNPPDVLLSITHPALIPSQVLRRVKIAALNYHDGPLPRYGGINGSSWALHNGERAHAIVWHHLTDGLDAGDILERRDLDIDPRETSVSLNMRNAALARASFAAVVDRLEKRELTGTAQASTVARTVFSRHDRPAGLCVIDWTAPAGAIDRLVRSCELGPYANRFGLAKIVHRDRAVAVHEAMPAPAVGAPGTVLAIDPEGVEVACGTGSLRLRGLARLTGDPLSPLEAAAVLGIRTGDVLEFDGRTDARVWTRAFAESEPFCVAALAERQPPQLPFDRPATAVPAGCTVTVPAAGREHFGARLDDAVVAAFCLVLSSLVRADQFDIAITSGLELPPSLDTLCCRLLPWRIVIDAGGGFSDLLDRIARERSERVRRPGFLLDLVARHPPLRQQPDLREGVVSSVAIIADGDPVPPGTELALRTGAASYAVLSDGKLGADDLAALAGALGRVLATVARAPQRPLATIDVLDPEQRQRQLFTWNATARPFPDTLRIHDLFEARVLAQPRAVALVFQGASMTFAEVEAGANRIANALVARGIGPGQYVGLLAERSFDLVLAMLGIAKSGAAYVPLDPSYPAERCRFMLADAGCVAVAASRSLSDRCAGLPVLLLDSAEVASAPAHRPASAATSGDVCYAIFTSGSTGKPKGVVLTHRAVVNTLDWVNREVAVTPADRLLFVTSPSFDLSVYDVFGALGAGASVEIAATQDLADPRALAALVCGGSITIWDSAPPALVRLSSFFPAQAESARLRLVMLSGDYIPVGLPDDLKRRFPGVHVKSLGGATEAAIWSNHYDVRTVDPAWQSIPYGYPIQNCRYYVLDHHRRPLPVGITGDLYIGGVCLASGYLGRPELTAERFLPDPFVPGERIYKTGDLARYWSDGTIEFRGRVDAQVKVRGFRVELGEVEAALASLPAVRQAVCVARTDTSGQKSLVAYVVPAEHSAFDASTAKERLGVTLPDFMVPSFIVVMDELPLNANGKLDRKALPAPEANQRATEARAARTPTEKALVEIWRELLEQPRIGIDETFFDLGGHSMLTVVLVSLIKQRLGIELPLSRVLECPTIEQLAASIDAQHAPPASGALIELRAGGRRNIFLVHDGDGEVLLYRSLAHRLPDDFGVYGILPRRLPGVRLAERSIPDMAAFGIREMRRRQPHGPYHLGGLCAGGVIAFEMAAQLERAGEMVDTVVLLEAYHPRATTRDRLLSRERLGQLGELFHAESGAAPAGRGLVRQAAWARAFPRVAAKLAHAAGYQLAAVWKELGIRGRLRVLGEVLKRGWHWPRWLRELEPRDIYGWAARRYRPGVVHPRQVILVRAKAAVPGTAGDRPGRQIYEDALFGWRPHVSSSLEVLDVNGGHSSMLQEPRVADLAAQLSRVL